MPRGFKITPENGALDPIKVPIDSLEPPGRRQAHEGERLGIQLGGKPASGSDGLQPGAIEFTGDFLGANGPEFERKIRAISDDPDTEIVTVQATDDNGNDLSSPFNGEYRILGDRAIEVSRGVASNALVIKYSINLTEL